MEIRVPLWQNVWPEEGKNTFQLWQQKYRVGGRGTYLKFKEVHRKWKQLDPDCDLTNWPVSLLQRNCTNGTDSKQRRTLLSGPQRNRLESASAAGCIVQ